MMKASLDKGTCRQKTIQTAELQDKNSCRESFVGMCVVYALASQHKESRFLWAH